MKFSTTLLAAVAAMGLTGAAQATVLTFDLAGGVTNEDSPGNYGDNVSGANTDADGTGASAGMYSGTGGFTPNVSVSYQGAIPSVWTTGYSDLTNVLYVEPDGTSGFGFTLTADTGFDVTLKSFDLGNFGGGVVLPSIIAMVDGAMAWGTDDYSLGGSGTSSQTVFPDSLGASLVGSEISIFIDLTGLGGQSDNIGIDNVSFGQAVSTTPSTVPLPAGLPLLMAGLGTFGLVRRKR